MYFEPVAEIGQKGADMKKILVLYEKRSIRNLYIDEFTGEGYKVVASDDCFTIKELIVKYRPDIIVMDIGLSKNQGPDFFEIVEDACCGIPVILCTDFLSFKYDTQYAGSYYSIVRNIDIRELKHKIEQALKAYDRFPSETMNENMPKLKTKRVKREDTDMVVA
ncbi:MAG: hypothetical protein B1H13_06965 [Desulfobacteraceae bacterium 4484_190.3]|nr:MAG: hypothetical protein B1H13_06965 [Desulfobacteraceae bacterium 4484_190.3]